MQITKASYSNPGTLDFTMDVVLLHMNATEIQFDDLHRRAKLQADRDGLTGFPICRRRGNKIFVTIRGRYLIFTLLKKKGVSRKDWTGRKVKGGPAEK